MAQHPEAAKDLALRAVGRTIVNFQRLEHNLKLAARLGPLQGTIVKIKADILKRNDRAKSLTLGQAIQAWLTYCDGPPDQTICTPDLFDVSFQMTFTLEADAEARISHAEALKKLLELRNSLVHSRLAVFDWQSSESCDNLVEELDGVNAAIAEQMQYISSLLTDIAALHKEGAVALVANIAAELARTPDVERNV